MATCASTARASKLAELGHLPTARDIVVRDIVNYHRHRLPLPRAGRSVALDLRFDRPAVRRDGEVVLQVGYTTPTKGDRATAEPCSVALVVDCSGSMSERGKMTQVHRGLQAFVDNLRRDDEVAVVAFSDEARTLTKLRRRGDGSWLRETIEALQPGGSTNLSDGLRTGMRQLERARNKSRRVVLLTDGIANRGVTAPDEIARIAQQHDGPAIDVSTIGVGHNLDTALLRRLADGTHGLFHFVADERDVQKVFVREVESLVAPAVRDVEVRVEVPRYLRIEQVYETDVRLDETRRMARVRLPDLNTGVTGVVLLRCRVMGADGDHEESRATLSYVPADGFAHESERATAGVRLVATKPVVTDHEVSRNHAIAILADGLAKMARACDRRRWADADRALQNARDEARRVFPGADDDVERVREIARGHARTLRRYVDRFRDF